MARGTEIIVSSNPKGVFLEGIIGDTSKPGTIMQVKAATDPVSGEHTWISANVGTDGAPALMAVLLNDYLQGQLATTAYVSGTRGMLYVPAPGEELNVLVGEGAGTSNTFNVGDRLMLDSDIGNLIPSSGSPQSVPFIVLEHLVQVAGPSLVWCRYTGH